MMEKPSKTKPSAAAHKSDSSSLVMKWNIVDLLAQNVEEEQWAVKNLIQLLEDGCSVPFIVRYRKEQTNHMEADKIREVIGNLDELKNVQAKASSAVKQIEKSGKMTARLMSAFQSAQTLEEVNTLFAPYKSGAKTTLAERARKLGLDSAVDFVLEKPEQFQLQSFVKPGVKGKAE
ncbi:S1 RNA-binding domain-containing protein 1-like [Acanthaster planci]|uniref:S1 RNA-binding domain-containing protein 1-like n=1 Tax=Acanthaster planci TaxID=133434 RepID=A0A8B7Y8C8_ACAPL|nr:S1 RNA-binding domain-containing protein 1-like [Acanthaster planci]XP_022088610.1 S1 RNA-binding domain-containing protein 1-like [Acanthaster planci]XP_022088611.1 S1 RNA-binding domain-containing protein 1-like [Acanthaster planci]XP_022088612.1 S1 RNA-binding domain-containing protein 1-like [Acanthaster planci]XP_022088613.1 S1 RNA-binding domain-containing protein 1-like [Acanthaster planci]XP_022088614.1 S1 RNA-binding domain-containing protein 1-like [Acanthaster planci]